jgi:hypothetical protein
LRAERQFLISGGAEDLLKKQAESGLSPELLGLGCKFYSKNIKNQQMTGFLIQFTANPIC